MNFPEIVLEILVVDGMSDDGCRTVVEGLTAQQSSIRLLDNPSRITPAALNTGIEAAKGDVIMRMDAHAIYLPDYIARSVEDLEHYGCDNVGGVWEIHPGDQTVMARAIAVAQGHPFAVGNAYYRIGVKEPRWVDTVPFGCFRKDVFDRVGLFDMDLIRNQDDEFNARLIRHGGRILLDPAIRCRYFARSTLVQVVQMFYQYGYYKPLAAMKVGRVMTVRQLVPGLFCHDVDRYRRYRSVLAACLACPGAIRRTLSGRQLRSRIQSSNPPRFGCRADPAAGIWLHAFLLRLRVFEGGICSPGFGTITTECGIESVIGFKFQCARPLVVAGAGPHVWTVGGHY